MVGGKGNSLSPFFPGPLAGAGFAPRRGPSSGQI